MVNAAVGFYRQITRGLLIATYLSKPFPKQALGFTCLQYKSFYPFPNDKIIDSSELKQFADDSFKFYKNGRQPSKRVENTVGKGEIACYEQFLLFPLCFQKICTAYT